MGDIATLDIILRAQYMGGAAFASAKRDMAGLQAQSSKATGAMGQAASRPKVNLERAALGLQNVGRAMTNYVTLPLGVASVAAGYFAYNFQKSMTKVQTMAGLSGAEVKSMSAEVLKLGPAIGKSPQELADALYFIASSGFRAGDSMKILTAVGKASAAGLGTVQQAADVTTSALSAYGIKNLSAAHAVDILIAAVREGKAEPAAFATTLGNIMPIAAAMKVNFGQVAGAIASITLTGASSAVAVTGLRQAMLGLSAPSKMTLGAMKDVGLSYKQITTELSTKGLLPTLKNVYDAADGSRLTLHKLIPNVRALAVVESLVGERYQKNLALTDRVIHSNGQLAQSFNDVKQSQAWKFDQALSTLKTEAVKAGLVVLPFFTRAVGVAASLVGMFNKLSPATQDWAIKLGIAAALFGPLAQGIAGFLRGGALITKALGGIFAGGGTAASGAGSAIGTSFAAAIVASIPAALIAAGVATVVGKGLSDGIKQAQANAKQNKGFWADFWSTFVAVPKGMASVSGDLYNAMGGGAIDNWTTKVAAAGSKLAADITTSTGTVHRQLQYMRQDFNRASNVPAVKTAMGVDTVRTKAQLMQIAGAIRSNLNIPLGEARLLVSRLFPVSWAANVGKGASGAKKSLSGINAEIARLRAQMLKKLTFGDFNVGPIQHKIVALEQSFATIKTKAQNASRAAANAPTIISQGLDRAGHKVKASAQSLVLFIQKPLGGMGPKFRAMGGIAGSNLVQGLQAQIAKIKTQIGGIAKGTTKIKIAANITAAMTGIRTATTAAKNFAKAPYKANLGVNDQATSQAQALKGALVGIFSSPILQTITIKTNKVPPTATGGVFYGPQVRLIGEAGPEAVVPLSNPTRAAQVMAQAGLARGRSNATSAAFVTLGDIVVQGNVYGVEDLYGVVTDATFAALEEAGISEGRSARGSVR